MGTILASVIVDKAELQLRDTGNVQWTANELLGWLNDGKRQIAIFKSDANIVVDTLQLAQGTRQELPEDCLLLLDIPRNMGTDGETVGKAITYAKKRDLDLADPDWHTDTASAVVQHYTYDQKKSNHFFVYPPQPNADRGYVEIEYNAAPADIAIGTAINIADVYEPALLDYVLFRAYSKESKSGSNQQKADKHWSYFMASLGVKEQREQADDPARDQLQKVDEA